MDNQVAKIILQQIGGRRFVAMTGSHDFINLGNGLRMSIAVTRHRLIGWKSSMTRAQTSTSCVSTVKV